MQVPAEHAPTALANTTARPGQNPSAQMLSAPARADHTNMRAPASAGFDCADFVRLPTRVRGQRLGGEREQSPAQVTISLPAVPTWWEAWKLVDT